MTLDPASILLGIAFLFGRNGGAKTSAPATSTTPATGPAKAPDVAGRWPRTVGKGGEVPIRKTWTKGTGDDWRRDHFKQIGEWMRDKANLTQDEKQRAREIAISVLAHWDLEGATGAAEYNYNAGGIGARPGDQYFKSKDAQSKPPVEMAFTAYDNFPQFIADYFGVLSLPRYDAARTKLLSDPTHDQWIRDLKKGGYYGSDENIVATAWKTRRDAIVKAIGP